jgi:hypothetical protein
MKDNIFITKYMPITLNMQIDIKSIFDSDADIKLTNNNNNSYKNNNSKLLNELFNNDSSSTESNVKEIYDKVNNDILTCFPAKYNSRIEAYTEGIRHCLNLIKDETNRS